MGETLAERHPRPEGRGVNLGDTLPVGGSAIDVAAAFATVDFLPSTPYPLTSRAISMRLDSTSAS